MGTILEKYFMSPLVIIIANIQVHLHLPYPIETVSDHSKDTQTPTHTIGMTHPWQQYLRNLLCSPSLSGEKVGSAKEKGL